ncbi:Trimethyllysine dioxygenase [Fusarium sp. LHS14.1]|nr:Trimethyllysine dioxygenase [Fusarium sp. LHS14.1]
MIGRLSAVTRPSSAALLGRSAARRARNHAVASFNASTTRWSSSGRTVALANGSKISLSRKEQGRPAHRTFPNLWLRDNCQCTQCVNQDTRQRNFDTFQLPEDVHPVNFSETEKHLEVQWSDSHKSQHPWSWLDSWFEGGYAEQFGQDDARVFWNSSIEDAPPEVPFDAVMSKSDEKGMADLTKNIWVHGFSFVVDTPPTPEATESLLEKVGPIRTTHYGGFYDFIPDLALADTAYTNLALPAHTDTTYFSEPAGLQAFHLLSHHAPPNAKPSDDALGGQSLLVDGFQVASTLKKESPEAYETLRTIQVPWHASGNKGIAIVPDRTYPVIEEDNGELTRVRWNNDDRGILDVYNAEKWYNAARKWNEIIRRRSSEYWFQLTPGRVVIFDNWRVMHGRSAFEGIRRICGAYTPRDDFMSRYRETNFPHESVIGRNLNMRARKPTENKQEYEAITRAP